MDAIITLKNQVFFHLPQLRHARQKIKKRKKSSTPNLPTLFLNILENVCRKDTITH